ncbi:MAG: hypothetical protein ACRBB6_11270 [Neptuniibacter sp.]
MVLVQKTWTQDQLRQMNEENFLVELLDMIKVSPVTDDSDTELARMKEKLVIIEAMIKERQKG